jgi:hypothetical protein
LREETGFACYRCYGVCRKAASKRPQQVSLVEQQRAHNICIELSGIHMAMADIKAALTTMDMSAVSTDALMVLQRAVPTAQEVSEIRDYLAGTHPKYRGISDVNRLGACERCATRLFIDECHD